MAKTKVKAHMAELVEVGFDYSAVKDKAAKLKELTGRIKGRLTKTLAGIIELGTDLVEAKEILGHGQFGPWLRAEFGWSERSARNFLAAGERFGDSANFAVLESSIAPSAVYLLAAPAVPDEATELAVERAEAGERITHAIAREIIREVLGKTRKKRVRLDTAKLTERLNTTLERFKKRWNQKEVSALVKALRAFADQLDGRDGRKRARKK